jgi:serine/threonine protein kinase
MAKRKVPTVSGYTLTGLRPFAKGGNADIWKARDQSGRVVAVKVLRTEGARSDSYQRFQREVREHARLTGEGFRGVLPLLDHHLPAEPGQKDLSYLVTPMAKRLDRALGERPPLESVVKAVAAIADTLARLHHLSIAHRDVKPGNCYRYKGEWVLGDFGLIETPLDAAAALTVGAKALGPWAFIAPEMVHHADTAAGSPADVYSLGKTLWALATGLPTPPIGEHRPEFAGKRLGTFGVQHPRAFYLDRLIDLMTREAPDERPAMDLVARELNAWASPAMPRERVELTLSDAAGAIADIFEQDRRVAAKRHQRSIQADKIAADIARRVPGILEQLTASGVQHSSLSADHTGISGSLSDEFNKTPDIDVAGWRSCSLQRNTGVGPAAFLWFGSGAALSRSGVVALGAVCVLNDMTGNRVLWIDTDTALIGSTSCDDKVDRLAEGLAENIPLALNAFHEVIAAPKLQPT